MAAEPAGKTLVVEAEGALMVLAVWHEKHFYTQDKNTFGHKEQKSQGPEVTLLVTKLKA